jgi:hypothetical protein
MDNPNQQQNVGESRTAHFNDAAMTAQAGGPVFGPQQEPPDLNRQAVSSSFSETSQNPMSAGNPWQGNRGE